MRDMIKNQKLFFISLIGIVVVSLSLISTYAYQSLQVEYKGKEELLVKAGVLDVSFTSTRRINLKNMPLSTNYINNDYTEFIIAAINEDTSLDELNFSIKMFIDKFREFNITLTCNDFKYTIVRVNNNDLEVLGEGSFINLVNNEYDFNTNTGEYINIKTGEKQTIRIYLWLNETQENQNYLENSYFKGIIEINSVFTRDLESKAYTKFNIYGNTELTYMLDSTEQELNKPLSTKSLGKIVNSSGINNGKYEIDLISNSDTFPIYLSNPLRCIDEVCDYIDAIKRKVIRLVGVTKLKNLKFSEVDNTFVADITNLNIKNTKLFTEITKYSTDKSGNNSIWLDNNNIVIKIEGITLDEFNNYINNNDVNLYYELNNVTEEVILTDLYSVVSDDMVVTDGTLNSSKIEFE